MVNLGTLRQTGNLKKVLLTVMVLGMVSGVLGSGTFATFTAQTTNPNNTFQAGTLVLSNTKTGGTTCFSTGGGNTDTNSNTNCDQLINATVRKPGDTASQTLTVKNEGSLAASALKLFSTACTNGNSSGESYFGTGLACGKVQLYIQQYSDASFTTPSACLYGGATGATCDFSDATKTLSAFQSAYGTSGSGLAVGSGLAAGASVYVKIAVQLPTDANNSFQGRQATMDFNWYMSQ
ncbi:MAG: SipW-dependent-type signal peptide-containing protein [Chloroflexota bacterium]|nr:SipW-dependent-type signal peptide-containing protein [Chloroflexota bacterium]